MLITRENYKIWFIDCADKNLSDSQIEELKIFLDENPDLTEEFNDLEKVILLPTQVSFPGKEQLKRSHEEISLMQFGWLCAAYHENDLSPEQQSEILEIITSDPEKLETFELIKKARLTIPEISYKNKRLLFRRTMKQKVMLLTEFGLSAAAVLAIILMTFLMRTPSPYETQDIINQSNNPLNNSTGSSTGISTETAENNTVVPDKKIDTLFSENARIDQLIKTPEVFKIDDDSILRDTQIISKADISSNIFFSKIIRSDSLIPFYVKDPPSMVEERSKIGKFIARSFRQKILNEKFASDSPLKGYEIAEAGVTGLNKLLGWEMALSRNSDANGDLSSIYFSSKILKFNAPVKKSEPIK